MANPYKILAAFKDDRFLVLIEGDELDPTVHRLRIAELICLDDRRDLQYWAAPCLARAMQQAADYYAEEMEKSRQLLEGGDRTASPTAERSGNPATHETR